MVVNEEKSTEELVLLFLEDCKDFNDDIERISRFLNNAKIEEININNDINSLIVEVGDLKKYKDNLVLTEEELSLVNNAFDKLKTNLVNLKNKHIHVYNEKVNLVNRRIDILTSKLNKDELETDIVNLLSKLDKIEECSVFIDGKWDQNEYLNTLEYDKLNNMNNYLEDICKELNIKLDDSFDLFDRSNYINNEINKISVALNGELSLPEINTLLKKCATLFERVVELDIERELLRTKLSKEMFSKYNEKANTFRDKITNNEKQLLVKKSNLVKTSNEYAMLSNELDQINEKYDVFEVKINEHNGEYTEEAISIMNNHLDNLSKDVLKVKDEIKEYNDKGILTKEQLDNIYKKVTIIANKHETIKNKVNYEPSLLNENDRGKSIYTFISKCENKIDDFRKKVSGVESIKGEKRREFNKSLNEITKNVEHFEGLLNSCKELIPDKCDELEVRINDLRQKYDEICNEYDGKCSLCVKSVRSVKKLYKKHKKLGLISAGLSSLSLLTSSFTLIPAIMHGNTVLANAMPGLKGMFDVFNRILGGAIGATFTSEGVWKLARGVVLSASVATTSLLKGLAMLTGGAVALLSPTFVPQMIMQIKKLVDKIKTSELKEKLSDSYHKGAQKVDEFKKQVNERRSEKQTSNEYDDLFLEYLYSKDSLDEFCKRKGISGTGKKLLKIKEEKKLFIEKMNKEEEENLKKLSKEKTSRRSS